MSYCLHRESKVVWLILEQIKSPQWVTIIAKLPPQVGNASNTPLSAEDGDAVRTVLISLTKLSLLASKQLPTHRDRLRMSR
jgi:hypothetical protein